MSLLVLGTVALDTVATPSGRRREMLGGSAVHFAMGARLSTPVNLVAIVGEDFPKRHIRFLQDKGVVLTSLTIDKGKTFRWEGQYKGDLNSALTLSTELGVLSIFKPKIADHQRGMANIFLANVDPDVQHHLFAKLRAPRLVGLDSMNYWIHHKKRSLLRLIKKVDVYVANDAEARSLTGEANLIQAAKVLLKIGPSIVVVKKGEHGVIVCCREFLFCLPAYPVEKVVDPTGAGDTFAGGFMGYLTKVGRLNAAAIRHAITYGTIVASFNVEGFGVGRTADLRPRDVESRLRRFRKVTSF